MKQFFLDMIITIRAFIKKMNRDNVGVFAAQASFFIVLSLFPCLMLLLTLIKYTPVTQSTLLTYSVRFMPTTLQPIIVNIVQELYSNSTGAFISIAAIAAIWSASKGVLAIIRGLNSIYRIDEKRGYIRLRLISSLYVVIFVLALAVSLVLLVFGNSIYKLIYHTAPIIYDIIGIFLDFKLLISFVILAFAFLILYRIVPNKKLSLFNNIPGAFFSAIGWIAFSSIYSVYINNFSNFSYMYGSLTTFIVLMLWVYFCMYIVFIGAEINTFIKPVTDHYAMLIRRKRKSKKDS